MLVQGVQRMKDSSKISVKRHQRKGGREEDVGYLLKSQPHGAFISCWLSLV